MSANFILPTHDMVKIFETGPKRKKKKPAGVVNSEQKNNL